MNSWDVLLTILGWLLAFCASVLAVAILLGVLTWVFDALFGKHKKKTPVAKVPYDVEAKVMANKLYMPVEARAFIAGTQWAWGFFHRKGARER